MVDIILTSSIQQDDYTKAACEMFDVPPSDSVQTIIKDNLSVPKDDWNVGLIVGASGSGKTTLLKKFGSPYEHAWDSRPVISNLSSVDPKKATEILCAVGLSSVPSWLRPYSCLSTGEQFRADLAYALSRVHGDIICLDEFTSVVDRNVARAASFALQKYLRRDNRRAVIASCHKDIIEWLLPDWIYDPTEAMTRVFPRGSLRRPKIELEVFRSQYEAWNLFKHHHYLTSDLNVSARCFMAMWNRVPVAFLATLTQPSGTIKERAFRASRTVVLPDYQGLGIGVRLSDYMGSLIRAREGRFFSRTVHPAMIAYRISSKSWKETSHSREIHPPLDHKVKSNWTNLNWVSNLRYCYSFEYIGKSSSISESDVFWDGLIKDIPMTLLD